MIYPAAPGRAYDMSPVGRDDNHIPRSIPPGNHPGYPGIRILCKHNLHLSASSAPGRNRVPGRVVYYDRGDPLPGIKVPLKQSLQPISALFQVYTGLVNNSGAMYKVIPVNNILYGNFQSPPGEVFHNP